MLFIYYPKCSTCQRAKKWLQDHHIDFQERHIVEENPTVSDLKSWMPLTDKPLKSFFNTSGLIYRNLHLSEKLSQMSQEEQLALLASNGMLVKRPLLILDDRILIGFKETEWEKILLSI